MAVSKVTTPVAKDPTAQVAPDPNYQIGKVSAEPAPSADAGGDVLPSDSAPLPEPTDPGAGGGGDVGPGPDDGGASTLPGDLVGDIPPPPIPQAPTTLAGGAGVSTFARPGTIAARPFRSFGASEARPLRFGPGAPTAGGGVGGGDSTAVSGLGDVGQAGLGADAAGELLRRIAARSNNGGIR